MPTAHPPGTDGRGLRPPASSRWAPVAAAAAVVLVAAGAVTAVAVRGRSGAPAPGTPAEGAPAPGAPADGAPADGGPADGGPADGGPAGAVVRDGDRVAGQGPVVALPGRPVQLCAPYATVLIFPEPVPAPCAVGVTLVGLDLDRLTERRERDGAVWGNARIEGVYRAGTVTVTAQPDAEPAAARPDLAAPQELPCPEPAAGWPRQPAGIEQLVRRLDEAVRRNPTVYNGPWVGYPYGWHLQDTANRKGTEVYLVGTTGDVAAAERELRAVFPAEHLCVTAVRWSKAAMDAAQARLSGPDAVAAGISGGHGDVLQDRVIADLVVLDETAGRYLATVAGGRVVPRPLLRRVP